MGLLDVWHGKDRDQSFQGENQSLNKVLTNHSAKKKQIPCPDSDIMFDKRETIVFCPVQQPKLYQQKMFSGYFLNTSQGTNGLPAIHQQV